MKTSLFTVKGFTDSANPWHYMLNCGITGSDWQVSPLELASLVRALEEMDDVHLSFALGIAENTRPELFADAAAKLLTHSSLSVRIGAYRVLLGVPRDKISDVLANKIEQSLLICPERTDFLDILARP